MSTSVPLLAPAALTVDLPEEGLTRGQIGTVVERLSAADQEALLVEFSDEGGEAYAIVPIEPEDLLVLHRRIQ